MCLFLSHPSELGPGPGLGHRCPESEVSPGNTLRLGEVEINMPERSCVSGKRVLSESSPGLKFAILYAYV